MDLIHPQTQVGTVTLTVSDLARSLAYYQERIGLRLLEQDDDVAVLGVADRPLLVLDGSAEMEAVSRATGLYHFALLTPSRVELSRTLHHLIATDTAISGASDHSVSEALYLYDPDGHGIEIYRDRPRSDWYDADGRFSMGTERLDVEGLLAEDDGANWAGLHPDTVMGHIHLRVANVDAARQFYTDVLGFTHMTDYPSASFVSAGGYHHHIGMNSWQSAGHGPAPENAARLVQCEIVLPDSDALATTVERVRAAGVSVTAQGAGWLVQDPAQNRLLLIAP